MVINLSMNIKNVEQTRFEVVIFNDQLKWSNLLFRAAKFYMHLFMNFLVLRDFIRFSVGYMTHKRLSTTSLNFCHMFALPSGIPSSCVPGFWPQGSCSPLLTRAWRWPALCSCFFSPALAWPRALIQRHALTCPAPGALTATDHQMLL